MKRTDGKGSGIRLSLSSTWPFGLVLMGSVFWLSGCQSAQETTGFNQLDAMVTDLKARTKMASGTAYLVIKDGAVVHEGYFGYADIDGEVLVDEDTVFYIASTTKAYLALTILLAEERGEISQDTTLQQLFPDLGFDAIDAGAVTVRHLLTHTSGLDNEPLTYAMSYTGLHGPAEHRRKMIAATYASENAALGDFEYSNIGYNILAVWLDDTYGRDWRETMDDWLISPLGMARTTGFISEAKSEEWPLAEPYSYKVGEGREPLYLRKTDDTMYSVGLLSTPRDVAKFLLATMNDGVVDGQRVLPPAVLKKQRMQQVAVDGGYFDGYAWGWMTAEHDDIPLRLHTGGFAGASASISYLPEQKIGLVVLHNENGLKANTLNGIIQRAAYAIALGESEEQVAQWVSETADRLVARSESARTRLAQEAAQRRAAAWALRLPMTDYAGTYAHPLSGEMVLSIGGEARFSLAWGLLQGRGYPGENADQMVVDLRPGSFEPVNFKVADGRVLGLTVNGVYFTRQ